VVDINRATDHDQLVVGNENGVTLVLPPHEDLNVRKRLGSGPRARAFRSSSGCRPRLPHSSLCHPSLVIAA
jgi:hypothetical protein